MDKKFISYALRISKQNIGLTGPNPTVGCVIVKNDEIIATGVTAVGGRPHAEVIAINKADKEKLRGATMYVTLEPCSHHGVTSPCVEKIIAAQIKKVVIATIDVDSRVNGAGLAELQQSGIEVVCGIFEDEAREINKSFFKARTTGLPYLTLKLATSLDGKIATKNFDSKWITSEKARQFAHYLRRVNSAIMVGAHTVRRDNPQLNCRLGENCDYKKTRIIVAREIDFDLKANIFQNVEKNPTIILTSKVNASQHIAEIKNLGVEFIFCAEKNNGIDLKDALQKLCAQGINSIFVEGGRSLATDLLQQSLIDELVWIQNKKIIGGDGIAAIGELGFTRIDEVLQDFRRTNLQELSAEDFASFYRM